MPPPKKTLPRLGHLRLGLRKFRPRRVVPQHAPLPKRNIVTALNISVIEHSTDIQSQISKTRQGVRNIAKYQPNASCRARRNDVTSDVTDCCDDVDDDDAVAAAVRRVATATSASLMAAGLKRCCSSCSGVGRPDHRPVTVSGTTASSDNASRRYQ